MAREKMGRNFSIIVRLNNYPDQHSSKDLTYSEPKLKGLKIKKGSRASFLYLYNHLKPKLIYDYDL